MDQFNKYKAMLSGFLMTFGCLFLVLALGGTVFGIVLTVANKVKQPTPLIVITAGKDDKHIDYNQRMPAPDPMEPVALTFEAPISKLIDVDPQHVTRGYLKPGLKLTFAVDLMGGQKKSEEEMTPNEKMRFAASKTTFVLDRPHFERNNKTAPWGLDDDDMAKFHKYYEGFADKMPADTDAQANADKADDGYHYAKVFGIWGVIMVAAAIGLRRFNPDLY